MLAVLLVLRFISQGKKSADLEHVSNKELRAMCENILQLITTTIDQMEGVSWPLFITHDISFLPSLDSLCRWSIHGCLLPVSLMF